ncbi:DUF481 domain-containing protein [Sulfurimonas sp.]|uniref:DUF481 domain-containing protein n=1 Tax=Sulfurimonas sp. TaxID=2022749 RepID=UPI002AAFAD13|nr:DUF481 domain-containing protein [Sulfurimonas sp.]
MKNIIFILLILLFPLFAQELQNTEKVEQEKPIELERKDDSTLIEIKDTSGLSQEEVREAVKKEEQKNVSIFQAPWEDLSPQAKAYDWIQTKKGEWFKGEIKAMYNNKLEFDSKEMGLYTFDFKDISQIKSFYVIGVNIEDVAEFSGIIRFKNDEITIIQGDKKFTFTRTEIIAFAPEGSKEFNYWSGKISFNLDIRTGNKEQYDYIASINLKRRTSSSNLYFDYLGRISSKDNETTANDHRINQKYDRYITRNFFWTPLFSEFYRDEFQNIKNQFTAGAGIGYTLVNNDRAEWDVSGGPAYTRIEYISVQKGEKITTSPALEISTKANIELNTKVDFKFNYKLTYSDEKSGTYKHHMISTLENELTSWLDLDFSLIWDYLLRPEKTEAGIIPAKSDFQFLVGLGVEF